MTDQKSDSSRAAVPLEKSILLVRNQRVILDHDLAELYGVSTKALNQAVSRNEERFPSDFAFKLTVQEMASLKSQIVTANPGRGGRRTVPFAFTEHGAIMAANILRSQEAVRMSVFVVRAFVKVREMVSTNQKLAASLAELEGRINRQDRVIVDIVRTMQKLIEPVEPKQKRARIGFVQNDE